MNLPFHKRGRRRGQSKRICPALDAAKGKLRGSRRAGSGSFTTQDIDPGTFIGDYSGPVVLDKEFAVENPDSNIIRSIVTTTNLRGSFINHVPDSKQMQVRGT
ncbi:uncharacterized protein Z519_05697 [Cladophialophora bantiana CBS 173.52]|uniref:Uncharacterized protein n=1 Tax=Cladophialophora bantiana (strain ATCC 10958 / CBS 173.52 / CDC B-1940 / NIH 8579) TaxID=1442370 RepID=A0A0D2G347_CLAB1|nr:uncharacterized protein Z519_05697 [Cladophialophora bantiana CBS 173.52]KIW93092.1 hypothetical protein Z519_05697 [Cladophialophora bantiana CBS 173.52]